MKKVLLFLFLLTSISSIIAQDTITKKRYFYFVGFQMNPYLKEIYLTENSRKNVYSLRGGIEPIENFRVGVEWHKIKGNIHQYDFKTNNYAVFSRYLFLKKTIQPFFEASAFYSMAQGTGMGGEQYSIKKFDYYIASGCAFNFIKGKFSGDIMLLFNHKYLKTNAYLKFFEPTFRINYFFNINRKK